MMPGPDLGAAEGVLVTLTGDELDLLLEALDSHIYWQLSDEFYRESGFVLEPGSDDAENAEAIQIARTFADRLEALKPAQSRESRTST